MCVHTHVCVCLTLDSTSLWASHLGSIYTKFQEVSFPWGEGTNKVFPSLREFVKYVLCLQKMSTVLDAALYHKLIYSQAMEFRSLDLTTTPSAWSFSQRMVV